ncbi:alkyldihydroxyacetonephosphate synthase isoform X2 [Pseudomyrmex gracilis]|uniref:alkyldihydroxyacetonephosphate synthase isoform X2 n=1 Tax=Pseudomyrmex gracilis TaxID=219809 RepID=UPI000994B406|nr:alkyldihydroxyacetonephosphate synthase isoform X2 [Pseudomyrmex gracilis]
MLVPGTTCAHLEIRRKLLRSATRQQLLRWNGWGYKDSGFRINDKNLIEFTGNRYPIGNLELPYFTKWCEEVFDVSWDSKAPIRNLPTDFPDPILSPDLLKTIQDLNIDYSTDGLDRLFRAHGHTLREIYLLKHSTYERIPDIVLWPKCHNDVVAIVNICANYGIVCIPFGGGTSVSRATYCSPEERRTIISLDTSQMNRILWIDGDNLLICCESGIIGQDLERQLRLHGFTCGHEPDSHEFSSLGGWVATRASGMKKNTYGNIEDLVVRVRMVTGRTEDPVITLERNSLVPRASCGPDFDHVILGSEGTLGVVTEVVLKIRPLPRIVKYGSIVFPNFQSGVQALREVAKERCQPASIRLMDNEQFQMGQTLRPESGWGGLILQGLKQIYITRIKGFRWDQMCVATLLIEGDVAADVTAQERKIYKIAEKYGGIPAGETNGERGYMLTFVIAYIRDLGIEYGVLAESFETSVPWNRTLSLCRNVKSRIVRDCHARGIRKYLVSCRVTQTYDAGCCIYFYMAINYLGVKNPVETYEEIEHAAREEILANGGSLSHHHGVGKIRASFYPEAVGDAGVALYRATKAHLDPHNIFATGNLVSEYKSKL